MNSRQRFLNAINKKPVDHVPLYFRLWDLGSGVDEIPFNWKDPFCRAEHLLQLGVDDTLLLEPPLGYTEEYHADRSHQVTDVSVEISNSEIVNSPKIIKKQYQTPEGALTQVVKTSYNWPHGNDIMLFSDFNISGYMEPIIKTNADVSRLAYLLANPTDDQVREFRENSRKIQTEAHRLGVAVEGGWSALGDSVVWLCGMENVIYWQMDQPGLIEALLDVLLAWELSRMDYLFNEGIDVWVHMAWYEGTDFWTPKNYRKMLKPRLQRMIDKAHSFNLPFRYIITKGWQPLCRDFLEMGMDCLTGIDPIQDRVDLQAAKEIIGSDICLMGGMNALTLTLGSDVEIRQAVDDAMKILSPGDGFILYPVDNIACEWPWEKAEMIIDQWKKYW